MFRRLLVVVPLVGLTAATSLSAAANLGFYGWGFRAGLSEDPDQVVIGIHQDLGEVAPDLRLQPNLEAGFGDDLTILSLTIPVHYRLTADDRVITPYLGLGVELAYVELDDPPGRGDDSKFEVSPDIIGGLEWSIASGNDLLIELHILPGETADFKLMAGWMLRAK